MARFWLRVRDGDWVDGGRVRGYARLLLGFYCLAIAWSLTGAGIEDPAGHPLGTDFVSFWTVSQALHRGDTAALYRPEQLAALEQRLTPNLGEGFYAWFYPPTALLLVYPLAWLPYLAALALWLAIGLALYLATLRAILGRSSRLWIALAFPAVFTTVSHGQNALAATALLGGGLVLLERRPGIAGLLLGALTFKPQLGLLVPVALVMGGYWRTFFAAAATALGLGLLAAQFFGASTWTDFLAGSDLARQTLEQGYVPFYKMQSAFAATRLLGGGIAAAYAVQAAVSAAAALAVAWAWQRGRDRALSCAALVCAGLLATPFVLDYDLTLLALPIAWLALRIRRSGAEPYELSTLALAAAMPLLARPLGEMSKLLIMPPTIALLLWMILRRMAAPGCASQDVR